MSLPTVVSGQGMYLYDEQGREYLDGSGGAAVSCLGHGDPDVTRAIKDQLDKVAFAHTGFLTSSPAEQLADTLVSLAPEGIDRVYLVSGGSEAVESALKLARQFFWEQGETQRRHFIARQQSYHGNTLAALATGGNQWRRKPFSPLMIETHHIEPCYEYRHRQANESAFEYGQRAADALEQEILRLGPDSVIAFVAEPVVGATVGAVPPVSDYFKRIRQICDQYGILLILDEVMCGMGRTGSLFACEHDGIAPDIITIAKGLGAGYQPIGAMLCSADIYSVIEQGSGYFQHGHTYLGHPVACAAALAVVSKLSQHQLVERSALMGDVLSEALHERFDQHPNVGDIRGRGLFQAIELVKDRESKQPFNAELSIHQKIKKAAFAAGLICYPMGGTIDGVSGDHILLAPPFIIEDTHVEQLVDRLDRALQEVLNV